MAKHRAAKKTTKKRGVVKKRRTRSAHVERAQNKPQMLKRRWPGFKAKRPTGTHFEVLHQAWSRGRGKWYIMGFASSLNAAQEIARSSGRHGDFAIRKIVNGRPQLKVWEASAARTSIVGV